MDSWPQLNKSRDKFLCASDIYVCFCVCCLLQTKTTCWLLFRIQANDLCRRHLLWNACVRKFSVACYVSFFTNMSRTWSRYHETLITQNTELNSTSIVPSSSCNMLLINNYEIMRELYRDEDGRDPQVVRRWQQISGTETVVTRIQWEWKQMLWYSHGDTFYSDDDTAMPPVPATSFEFHSCDLV